MKNKCSYNCSTIKRKPILFTKKTSAFPKKAKVVGSKSLKMKNRMAVGIMLAYHKTF
jgi:hypothetical protein